MNRQRLGMHNGRAVLTDAQIDELRSLREDEIILPGKKRVWSYRRLAACFGVSRRYAIMLCNYEYRHGVPDEW